MTYMIDNHISICFVSESWLTSDNNNITATIKSYGFNIIHKPRRNCDKLRGGGVAIIFHSSLKLTQVCIKHGELFESVLAKFRNNMGDNVCCCCVYRPGPLTEAFFSDFDEFIGSIFLKFSQIIICGDLNIHLDNPKLKNSSKFLQLLSSYGLTQLVTQPTHQQGHILDVVISSNKVIDPENITANPLDASIFPTCDHFPITFNVLSCLNGSRNEKKTISFRNLRSIDSKNFKKDLVTSLSDINCNGFAFDEIITTYNNKCNQVLDEHAPVLVKQITDRKSAPWFDGEYKCLRSQRRKAERKWKKSELPEDREHYVELRNQCTNLADKKKHACFKREFEKYDYSPKSLYKFANSFMDKEKTLTLPPSESLKETVDNFNNFFQDKITRIRNNFPPRNSNSSESSTKTSFVGQELDELAPTTLDEIEEILRDTDLKSSSVDPLPSSILKENKDTLIPLLCDIVNASLSSGSIDGAKLAHISPLIKGYGLDPSDLKNYRPISNLTFVGKLIERVVLRRLNDHLDSNNLNISHQSGYKKRHSTETLLVRVVNDLLIASTENKATVVMLLDLSAAFDTVDHDKLLAILRHELGITGTAWKWFHSFLTGRCQKVRVDGTESYEVIIKFGVPQGSVLGPVLFNLYIRSLYSTVKNLTFAIHGYADDHQVYKSFLKLDQYTILVDQVPACFREISNWMSEHFLQLNPGKTEIIVFGTPAVLGKLTIKGTFLDSETCIRFSPVAKNLGFRLDECLTFEKQVTNLKTSCFLKLRAISKMKPFLTTQQMTMFVQAVIISSLDYCNALYYGCNKSVTRQLQVIQNRACRIIFGLKKRADVNEKMQSLHWLKIDERIVFKILLLVYKGVHGMAPSYINELLSFNNIVTSNKRRSSLHISLQSHPRAFETVAPKLWHQLPSSIRTCQTIDLFKTHLKTYLFKKSYNLE
jgi:hypothetical protein